MDRGDKDAYTDKQKRQAAHIEEGYEKRGVSKKVAQARAWATVNEEDGGGNKRGSGRGKPKRPSAKKPAAKRSTAQKPASERSTAKKRAAPKRTSGKAATTKRASIEARKAAPRTAPRAEKPATKRASKKQ